MGRTALAPVHRHGFTRCHGQSDFGGTDPVFPIREAEPAPSFIETQFPVSRLSKESYKERKANSSQTLTGLGKWWGRKPLILVRAVILGLLVPATEDPERIWRFSSHS